MPLATQHPNPPQGQHERLPYLKGRMILTLTENTVWSKTCSDATLMRITVLRANINAFEQSPTHICDLGDILAS